MRFPNIEPSSIETSAPALLSKTVRFSSFYEDFQTLLMQLGEDRGFRMSERRLRSTPVVTTLVDVTPYLEQVRKDFQAGRLPWDYRGPEHVASLVQAMLAGEDLPPLVVENGKWVDGRHRLFALEILGQTHYPVIELSTWLQNFARDKSA